MIASISTAEVIPQMRIRYRMLRDTLDPRRACRLIADSYGCSLDFARRAISLKETMHICSTCWGEYFHARNNTRNICDECLIEEWSLENRRKRMEARRLELFPKKFIGPEETISQTMAMLTMDYGMTRDEALRYIGEAQEANAMHCKDGVEEFQEL